MISTLNKISSTHNSCEDSIFVKDLDGFIYGGVFDGCSQGINSAWASQTMAYVFGQYAESLTSDDTAKLVKMELSMWKSSLNLTQENFESTAILFVFEKQTARLTIRAIGDGFFFVNGTEYELDQNDKVDYFGDHLNDSDDQFNAFMEKYPVQVFENVTDFKICSDGIQRIERSQFADPTELDPLKLLFAPPVSSNYLNRQWNILKNNKFFLSDDLSIISYVQD